MKPFVCLLLFAICLALVDSYEVKAKYLAYSPEEEARYQSNLVFLKNFIKEQRYDKYDIFMHKLPFIYQSGMAQRISWGTLQVPSPTLGLLAAIERNVEPTS